MIKHLFYSILLVDMTSALASFPERSTQLSPAEKQEISERLSFFYSSGSGAKAMDTAIPKMNVVSREWADPNSRLKSSAPASDLLLQQVGKKNSPEFQKARCKYLFKRKFPFLDCDEVGLWDETEQSDPFENLVKTWIPTEKLVRSLNGIPDQGEIEGAVWSGDYWRMQWGLTSYRYADRKYYSTYREAVDAYHQPGEWLAAANSLPIKELEEKATKWSPSEKYDLLVGDENMTLTQQQKEEGSYNLGENGNVESWFGICHGWAPASFMVPSPRVPLAAVSARGAKVTWYPDDVKAMATLAWANGNFRTNFIGGRCNQKSPERFENGRLSQPECFDNNPVSFHLALGNMIGIWKRPMVMDSAFDYQVWNQPILSYEFEYFNPLQTEMKGKEWQKLTVPYDSAFKQKDRFQTPLTRGRRLSAGRYDDSHVTDVVGVIATVVYLAESSASPNMGNSVNTTIRVVYTYDLEFESQNGTLIPTGGEWHENRHPDFLWVPEKDSVAKLSYDTEALNIDLKKLPESRTTSKATEASRSGYPLCRVLEQVVGAASGTEKYRCAE